MLTMSYKILKQSLLINATEKVFEKTLLLMTRNLRNNENFFVQALIKDLIASGRPFILYES